MEAVWVFKVLQPNQSVFGDKHLLDFVQWRRDEFFATGSIIEEVVGEVFAESFNEGLVVFCCVEFLCTEQLAG